MDNHEKDMAGALKDVIGGLFAHAERSSIEQYMALADNPAIQKAAAAAEKGDQQTFRYALIVPFDKLVDGILAAEMPTLPSKEKHAMYFLMKHGDFVQSHFRHHIENREGSACCADKARWIVRSLLRFYMTGKEIVLDRTQEYTFHLPTEIFTTHEKIVDFFDALQSLYSGRSLKYLAYLPTLTNNDRSKE